MLDTKRGVLVYKCRRCDAHENFGVGDVGKAVSEIARIGKYNTGRFMYGLIDYHVCKDNRYGIMDLIGGDVTEDY